MWDLIGKDDEDKKLKLDVGFARSACSVVPPDETCHKTKKTRLLVLLR